MPWSKPQKSGWASTAEDASVTRFMQVIHTVIQVVAGGVIRAGKVTWDDDAHVGFWLGVCPDRVARFSVGGPSFWLKWTGEELLVLGRLSMRGGNTVDDRVEMLGQDGACCAYFTGTDSWGHQAEIGVPAPHDPGAPGFVDLFADGDFAASIRLRLKTERGGGPAATRLQVLVGNSEAFAIDGSGNVWVTGTLHAAGGVQ